MAGRKRRINDSSDDESEDSDCYVSPRKAKKSRSSKAKVKKPTTKAEITIRATDTSPDEAAARDRINKVDDAVLARIKKALALGNHAGTGEEEARAAIRMATKLLERHNVTQADILSQETDAEKLQRAGTSTVSVKRTSDTPGNVNIERWANNLAHAMTIFFDCQFYTTKFDFRVDWCFYGLAEQTVAAAHAFEMTYNLILSWSLDPSTGKGIHAKNCYRIGVAHGLNDLAKADKKEEQAQALRREQALLTSRQDAERAEELARIKRLNGPVKVETDQQDTSTGITEEETTDNANPGVKDFRVKMEEVEDEDIKRTLNKFDDVDQHIPEANTGANASLSDVIPLEEPTILEGTGLDFDEPSDDEAGDNFHDGGMSDHDHFVPATFNDSDDVDNLLDLDAAEIRVKGANATPPPFKATVPLAEQKPSQEMKEEVADDSQLWSSVGQLIAFRETSVAVAEDYLKTQGIKLSNRASTAFTIKNAEASNLYRKGKEDAKKIDVKRKLLKDAEDD